MLLKCQVKFDIKKRSSNDSVSNYRSTKEAKASCNQYITDVLCQHVVVTIRKCIPWKGSESWVMATDCVEHGM